MSWKPGSPSSTSLLMKSMLSPAKHRTLYLSPVYKIAGAEMSLLGMLRNINREVFEPLVALSGPGPLVERIARLGVETVIIPQQKLKPMNPLPYLKTVFSLVNLIRTRQIDLIHSNIGLSNQYGVVAARLTDIPIICHIRDILSKRSFRRMFLGYSDVLIANSHAVASSYAKYVAKSQKVVVIHNGVDLKEFSPICTKSGVFRRKLGLPDDAFIVGHIARICPEKGQHTLIDAMARVAKTHSEVYALIAGNIADHISDAFLMSLKQRVREQGLCERIIFTGFVDNIIELYADLDLVILPSLFEPFGRTLIEAMAMEKPVIAAAVGGPLEVVVEGETGFLVPPNDPDKLAEALLKILQDKELAKRLGENGKERVKRFFTIEEYVRKNEQVYLELLNSKNPGLRTTGS